MKDLFVELARLQASLAAAAETALALRTEMLAESSRAADLEADLTGQLLSLSTEARQFATEIRSQRMGINFTDAELAGPAPARRKTRKRSKA